VTSRPTPYLVVDLGVLGRNLSAMAELASRHGLSLRPHVKTHKCLEIAARQLGAGAVGITVATVAEAEIFVAAGFEWREPGCSMCLAMNPDKLAPGERCASTSNRNFEGRQGYKGRTHLVSPAMAAAAAIAGRFVDVREWR